MKSMPGWRRKWLCAVGVDRALLFLAARRIDSSFDRRAHVWRMWYPMELHRTTAKRASKQPLDCGSTTGRGGDASHTVLEQRVRGNNFTAFSCVRLGI